MKELATGETKQVTYGQFKIIDVPNKEVIREKEELPRLTNEKCNEINVIHDKNEQSVDRADSPKEAESEKEIMSEVQAELELQEPGGLAIINENQSKVPEGTGRYPLRQTAARKAAAASREHP